MLQTYFNINSGLWTDMIWTNIYQQQKVPWIHSGRHQIKFITATMDKQHQNQQIGTWRKVSELIACCGWITQVSKQPQKQCPLGWEQESRMCGYLTTFSSLYMTIVAFHHCYPSRTHNGQTSESWARNVIRVCDMGITCVLVIHVTDMIWLD